MPKPQPQMNEHGFPRFAPGTKVKDVTVVDRGQKMMFTCSKHDDTAVYVSKEPWCSRWFFAAENRDECDCKVTDDVWVLVSWYSPTRND